MKMNRIYIILALLISTVAATAQSIDNYDQVPTVPKNQHFTYIAENGSVETLEDINERYLIASDKLKGDAICIVTNVPVYEDFIQDFYTKNNLDSNSTIILMVNYYEPSDNRFALYGSISHKDSWLKKRFAECYEYEFVKKHGDLWKVLADSLCAIIGDVEIDEPEQNVADDLSTSASNGIGRGWNKYKIADRTINDPKVHKSFLKGKLTQTQLRLALETPYVDTAQKIYDAAGLLSDNEIAKLQNSVHDFVNKYNCDMAIVTIDYCNKQPSDGNIATENYAMDFYEYNDFGKGSPTKDGYDGVILVIDMQNRKFSILDVGKPHKQFKIAQKNVDRYISAMAPNLTAQNYYDAINTFITSYSRDIGYFYNLQPNNWDKYIIANRTVDDPKVNKKYSKYEIDDEKDSISLQIALNTPYVDTTQKVYDAAGLLTDDEIAKLQERIHSFVNKYNVDMAVVTISRTDGSSSKFIAKTFYDYNDFGKAEYDYDYNGVIMVINMQDRDYAVVDFGEPNSKWEIARSSYNEQYNKYDSDIRYQISDKLYYDAILKFIDSYEHEYWNATTFPWTKCTVLSLIIALIFFIKEIRKYKNVFAAQTAINYVEKYDLTKDTDTLISTKTTRRYSPRSSGSSGGSSYRSSGSSHSSSSGRSFGGGSGSF